MRNLFHAFYYWINVLTWVKLIILLVVKREVKGLENVPRKGAVILAGNHLNLADPPILTAIMPRRIVWMGKQELFDIPVVGFLYHLFGCIPVRRFQADLRALRRSEGALRRGLMLGMFPEGTRMREAKLGPGEPGTALLAMRTNTPILPFAIWGTEGVRLPRAFFQRTSVQVRFGEPFYLERPERLTKEAAEAGTAVIMRRIAAMLPERYRGVHASPEPQAVPAEAEGR